MQFILTGNRGTVQHRRSDVVRAAVPSDRTLTHLRGLSKYFAMLGEEQIVCSVAPAQCFRVGNFGHAVDVWNRRTPGAKEAWSRALRHTFDVHGGAPFGAEKLDFQFAGDAILLVPHQTLTFWAHHPNGTELFGRRTIDGMEFDQ
ncbi:hypothetical protein OF001_U20359 [Pseudomonas sp. OF001]|uniref:hypothetical protein n=1 Tax=Pseudomonas sp. OF001 TaxID=2772300 RepID=UPI001919E139|nr:hypothetical protein [Pseudomonas sp. OF001]CAD5377432.1 hypothetical protein OF001_U20359 [Pseudomonas sp. OF001]